MSKRKEHVATEYLLCNMALCIGIGVGGLFYAVVLLLSYKKCDLTLLIGLF